MLRLNNPDKLGFSQVLVESDVNPQLYQRIDKEALFNLTPDVRTPLCAVEFLPEPDIAIQTSLKPDLLPHLAEHTANIDEVATYLLSLSQWLSRRKWHMELLCPS